MKKLLPILFFLSSSTSFSQVSADPAIDPLTFSTIAGFVITDTLPLGYIAQLNIPIKNLNTVNGLPAGTCKIKIGLGSKIILDPDFNLNIVNTSQYFKWTAELNSGQVQITGDLIAELPPNFSDVAKFNVKGNLLDNSTVTSNFLITNHNSLRILSDSDPANNSSFKPYKIIPPITVPVNFTGLTAIKKDCAVDVAFTAENEIDVASYDVEVSKDGLRFIKVVNLKASTLVNYKTSFDITENIASANLFIRIKSIDKDGSFKYSSTKSLAATCNSKLPFQVYPNPFRSSEVITIKAAGALLNGKYNLQLFDALGKIIIQKNIVINNQSQFSFSPGNIPAGQYVLKVVQANETVPVILKIQKR